MGLASCGLKHGTTCLPCRKLFATFLATYSLFLPTRSRAKAVLEESFPERKVVQLMTREVLLGGGNVHCITQQQPVGAPAQQLAAL